MLFLPALVGLLEDLIPTLASGSGGSLGKALVNVLGLGSKGLGRVPSAETMKRVPSAETMKSAHAGLAKTAQETFYQPASLEHSPNPFWSVFGKPQGQQQHLYPSQMFHHQIHPHFTQARTSQSASSQSAGQTTQSVHLTSQQQQQTQKSINLTQQSNRQQQQQQQQNQKSYLQTVKQFAINQMVSYATYRIIDAFDDLSSAFKKGALQIFLSPLKFPLTYAKVVRTLTDFAEGVSESNRQLSMWDSRLANSFARLDFTRQRLSLGQAQATGSSGALLNRQIGNLLISIQPFKNALNTLVNIGGSIAAKFAENLAKNAKGLGVVQGILNILKALEKKAKPAGAGDLGGLDALVAMAKDRRGRAVPGERRPDLPNVVPRLPLPPLRKRNRGQGRRGGN